MEYIVPIVTKWLSRKQLGDHNATHEGWTTHDDGDEVRSVLQVTSTISSLHCNDNGSYGNSLVGTKKNHRY